MSEIYFTSPSGEATLNGQEHKRLWNLPRHMVDGILAVRTPGSRERMAELTGTAVPEDFKAFQQWAVSMEYRFTNAVAEGITWRGQVLNKHAFVANTVMAAGSDPVRLAVRITEQCDDHCWVEGPDREWLAGLIGQGLDSGVLERRILNYGDGPLYIPTGWEDIRELLLSRDDEPVVLSHDGSGRFANEPPAGWRPDIDGDDDAAYDLWAGLEAAEQRRIAMDALRALRPWQRLDPDGWHAYRFVHGLSIFDLLADDYAERLDKVLGAAAL